jgi:translation initiation factor IF-2
VSGMKAHELARELGISQKELVNFLQQRRLTRNAAAPLAPGAIEAARSAFKPTTVATKIETNGDRRAVLPPNLTVKDLAEKLGVSPVDVIKKLMASRIFANVNQVIDFATAEIVADEFGFTVEPVASEDVVAVESAEGEGDVVTTSREELFSLANEDPTKLRSRPPIVTVMGHVDHGKTSILDSIRKTHVAAGEAGGITQRIGAYQIETADGHPVVFIDTPGHEAFTAMRARGAQVTDLVVLVVAADDGVMPQTIEAIHHARAAKVPIIVAINKVDKDNANVDRVHQQLAEQGIVTRHYGGEYECVHLSARTGKGIDDLLTTIVLSSDILELKANPDRNALGTIVDAHLERGRGPVATVLVQAGTLKVGDDFVCGHIYGRVRALADDRGRSVSEAPPATPVVVSGMSEVPQAGDIFQVVGSEKAARQIALTKLTEKRAQEAARDSTPRITLEDLARRAKEGEVKELSLVVKADAQGTLEAVLAALQKIEDPVVAIKVVGQGVGAVSDSDLLLASVSSAIIVCFNLKPTPAQTAAAERAKVEVRYYDVIYKLTEDVERAAKGLREPTYRQIREGKVEVITPIKIPRTGIIAGSRVVEGKVSRGGWVKLFRARAQATGGGAGSRAAGGGQEQIHEGRINSLKHFKEDVREMLAGQECGIGLEGWEDFQPGDTMETYRLEREEI